MSGATSRPDSPRAAGALPGSDSLGRLAGPCLILSAIVAAVGVAFLVAMYIAFGAGARAAGMAFGLVNDALVLVSFPLVVPGMLVLRGRLRSEAPWAVELVTVIGLAAVAAIVALQALLIRGDLAFEEQIGWVSIAFVAFDIWLVVVGWLGGRSGTLPGGVRMGLIGATYVGSPVWALWAARRLAAGDDRRASDATAG